MARHCINDCGAVISYFYSRASCEARPGQSVAINWALNISTHAPRVRRDLPESTYGIQQMISTHAPRVRRDIAESVLTPLFEDFYSRASCEARLKFPDIFVT